MTWDDLDWRALDRLRERFLRGPAAGAAYWESRDDLASYDLTYGERIGWKWDQVLRELDFDYSMPPGTTWQNVCPPCKRKALAVTQLRLRKEAHGAAAD